MQVKQREKDGISRNKIGNLHMNILARYIIMNYLDLIDLRIQSNNFELNHYVSTNKYR